MRAQQRLGFFFTARLDGGQQSPFLAGDVDEELRIVVRQILGGLFKVGDERRGEDLQDAVAAGFKQKQME